MTRTKSTTSDSAEIPLPPPHRTGGLPIHEALATRRSRHEFLDSPLSPEQVSQLCWAAQGISGTEGERTAPSAGARFPLNLFLVDSVGAFEYLVEAHALKCLQRGSFRRRLQAAALEHACIGAAPLTLILTIDVAHSAVKYGQRAERYCLLEAGHAAQNVLLEATSLGLGSVPIGAFYDNAVSRILKLPENRHPVYLLPVGRFEEPEG